MERGDKLIILREVDVDPVTSRTTQLIAALAAVGIPLDSDCPYLETRELIDGREQRVVTWTIKPESACERFITQAMIRAWNETDFVQHNPEHPLSYIKAAFQNHARVLESIISQAPLALIRKGKRMALIPFDATPERRKELLEGLEK